MCTSGAQRLLCLLFWLSSSAGLFVLAAYVPLRQYAGPNFFDAWDYYGFYDNTTWGNVTFVDRQTAISSRLTYVNGAGNAVLRVDNASFVQDGPLVFRNSVRITSRDAYGIGSLIMIDVRHIPYGCSVWPSFWTLGTGKEWPQAGEIDIIEGINMISNNQIALHSTPGCFQDRNPGQTGRTIEGDCSTPQGCLVAETKPNSWGPAFAQAGGGVWAVQIDAAGVFVWFWSRPDVPENIRTASQSTVIDTAPWGMPSASYPAMACNVGQFFTPQQLVLLITLCGTWAGVPEIYASTCHTPKMSCLADNIVGPGSPTYDNAFWEISWIRTYTFTAGVLPGSPATVSTNPVVQNAPSSSAPSATNTIRVTSVVQPSQSQVAPASSDTSRITIDMFLRNGLLVAVILIFFIL